MAAPDKHTVKELFQAIQAGDRAAFRHLFELCYQMLLAVAINILRDVDLAKDVVQEVFFQVWKKREELQIHSSVEAYLKRAVINRSLNQIKARKAFVEVEELEQESSNTYDVSHQLEGQELQDALQQALDSLPERCRLIFVLRRHEGLSHKEIAEKLNISPKTIENQLTKALKVLRKAVQKYQEKEEQA